MELRRDVSSLRQLISYQHSLGPLTPQDTEALVARAVDLGWEVEGGCAERCHTLTGGHPFRVHYLLYGVLAQHGSVTRTALRALHEDAATADYLDRVLRDDSTSRP